MGWCNNMLGSFDRDAVALLTDTSSLLSYFRRPSCTGKRCLEDAQMALAATLLIIFQQARRTSVMARFDIYGARVVGHRMRPEHWKLRHGGRVACWPALYSDFAFVMTLLTAA